MIVDVIYVVVASVLSLITALFGAISVIVPTWVQTALHTGIGYFNYLQPLLPITKNPSATGLWQTVGILDILGFVVSVVIGIYLIKLALMAINLLPIIKKAELPSEHHETN